MIQIVHIMPHLGGGVGKALSTLVSSFMDTDYCHSFLLLEQPNKRQFVDKIIDLGCKVYIQPDDETTSQLINNADIVQLEWWSHPSIFQFLCTNDLPEMKLIVWCHVSGIYTPIIPTNLIKFSKYFLFTSECSFKASNIVDLGEEDKLRLGIVSSGTGFDLEEIRKYELQSQLSYGYMGSLNPSKIHPQFIDYLSKVSTSEFKVSIWGDDFYKDMLIYQCEALGHHDLIEFKGYTNDPVTALASLDVFVYLLNSTHYGTAENVLLEAMSLGVIPIVMNNQAEITIVEHGKTGLVVSNQKEFVEAVHWLENNPDERKLMSGNVSKKIAEQYSPEVMFQSMRYYYDKSISSPKTSIDFKSIFGNDPYDWYTVCQKEANAENYEVDDSVKNNWYEETKGSLNHYLSYFPDNIRLNKMSSDMNNK